MNSVFADENVHTARFADDVPVELHCPRAVKLDLHASGLNVLDSPYYNYHCFCLD